MSTNITHSGSSASKRLREEGVGKEEKVEEEIITPPLSPRRTRSKATGGEGKPSPPKKGRRSS